jgi:hypothetical protein
VSGYNGPERRNGHWFTRAVREFGHDPPPEARWHHIWRDFVPLLALIIAAYAVFGVEDKADKAGVKAAVAAQVTSSQVEGRRTAVAITCGAVSAVIESGRASILAGVQLPPKLERRLVSYGYPTKPERVVAARKAANAYSLGIASAVEKESGVQGIVRRDGSLDCGLLLKAARATP